MASLVTNSGKALVAGRMKGSASEPSRLAWGTGAGTTAATDTTLFTESTDESRVACTTSVETTDVTGDTYQAVGTLTVATADKTITNVGLFDAASSGNLFVKSDFTGLPLAVGDSVAFTLKVKFT